MSLQPFHPPLGPQPQDPNLYFAQPTRLIMRERLNSMTSTMSIKSADTGHDVLTMKGKLLSLHGKKLFYDMSGREILTLGIKLSSLGGSGWGESTVPGANNFEIQGKFKLNGSRMVVKFRNAADGKDVELEVVANWSLKEAKITTRDGRLVASIGRNLFSARDWFGDVQTYHLAIAPGVDISLIAAVCEAYDTRETNS